MFRQPHTTQIRDDHGVVFDEHGRQRRPHVARIGETVQQHDSRPFSADACATPLRRDWESPSSQHFFSKSH